MLHSIVLCVFAARLSLDRHCSSFKIKTNKESDEKNSSITMKRSIKAKHSARKKPTNLLFA